MKNKLYKGKYFKYFKPFIAGEITIYEVAKLEDVSYSTVNKAFNKCKRNFKHVQQRILKDALSNPNAGNNTNNDNSTLLLNTKKIDHVLDRGDTADDINTLSTISTSSTLKKLATADIIKTEVNKMVSNLLLDPIYKEIVIKEQVYNILKQDLTDMEHSLNNGYDLGERSKLIRDREDLKVELKKYELTLKEKVLLKRFNVEKQYYTTVLNDKDFKQIVKSYLYTENL
ncbi:hypothetical protein [Candidatus Borreliella tachyglossi]|uniref:hypothetical protein n=1 Tax=Candidatus Borreliella tachyglossi TaxID=1964448 RepID=UPI004041EB9F